MISTKPNRLMDHGTQIVKAIEKNINFCKDPLDELIEKNWEEIRSKYMDYVLNPRVIGRVSYSLAI